MAKRFPKTPPRTERTIEAAMEEVLKKGIPIEQEKWGVAFDTDKGHFVHEPEGASSGVCALGALLLHKNCTIVYDETFGRRKLNKTEANDVAAYVLGVNQEWVTQFIDGFDGSVRALWDSVPFTIETHVGGLWLNKKGELMIDIAHPKLGWKERKLNLKKDVKTEAGRARVRVFLLGSRLYAKFKDREPATEK